MGMRKVFCGEKAKQLCTLDPAGPEVKIPILGLPTFVNSLVLHTKASLNQSFCHLE